MSYLQFDSTTLCKTPYPLNEIRYRVPFYKISGLGFDLNELDFGKDGVIDGYFGIRTVMLGLPLGVIFSQYDVFPYKKLKKAGAGALSLRVGFENVFTPFDPAADPDGTLIRVSIHGDDIKGKNFSHQGKSINLTPDAIKEIQKKGTVLYKKDDVVYRLKRAQEVQYVREKS